MALPTAWAAGDRITAARLNELRTGLGTMTWALGLTQASDTAGGGIRLIKSDGIVNGYWDQYLSSANNGYCLSWMGGTAPFQLLPAGYLLLGYSSSNGAYNLQVNSQIFATSSTVATSDARYKEDVKPLTGGLAAIQALKPVSFRWKEQPADIVVTDEVEETVVDDKGKESKVKVKKPRVAREKHNFQPGVNVGFIAQDVASALADKPWVSSIVKANSRPAVVHDGVEIAPAEEFLGLATGDLIAILTSAVQELAAEVAALKKK